MLSGEQPPVLFMVKSATWASKGPEKNKEINKHVICTSRLADIFLKGYSS